MRVPAEKLKQLCSCCLKSVGCSENEAEFVSNLLVLANLRGHDSHGVGVRLPAYIDGIRAGRIKVREKAKIVKETSTMALIDGKMSLGQVVAAEGMRVAIEKARKNGVGMVSIFNCNHIGRLADYAVMALEYGMIGFVCANSGGKSVAPHGGAKGVFGTNPLCFAIPAGEEEPIVVDLATSVFAAGKLSVAAARGEQLPQGVLLDSTGHPSTDPNAYSAVPKGVLLPFGGLVGYKGYGLSMVVDILSGALSGSGCASHAHTNGVFMMVLDVNVFRRFEEFGGNVDQVIRECKTVPVAPGYRGLNGEEMILIPGEPERIAEKENTAMMIYVDEPTWNRLAKIATDLGVDIDKLSY